MKYLTYIFRNARRNPVRSFLTIASTAVSLFLMMILVSFFTIREDVLRESKVFNRIITMSAQGFAGDLPVARVKDVTATEGIVAATPFRWYGGKYHDEVMPFAQFGVNPDTVFSIYDELTIPPDQLEAFRHDKAGCVVGRKLADERGFKIGDPLPLKGNTLNFDLNLTIRGIYDGPTHRNRSMCFFHWDYLDEGLKKENRGRQAGNAGMIVAKCSSGDMLVPLCRKIDGQYVNSDTPTRTQSEEAFAKMFGEMMGDLQVMMRNIGYAVIFSLICVAGNSMAMALRERTTEIAVLKAIGFGKQLVLFLVLAEAMIVSGIGGLVGTIGSKFLCDVVDLSRFMGGFLPFFFIPWTTALVGLSVSFLIGFVSGIFPAFRASQLSVVNGLRKVG
jgi:putative ABC transport system permease protein